MRPFGLKVTTNEGTVLATKVQVESNDWPN
jgi:hypothetical protein